MYRYELASPWANTYDDYYILKIDTSGTELWNKSFGSSAGEVASKAILNTADSSIIICGISWGGTDYMATNAGNHNGSADIWVVKADKDGNYKWSVMCGGVQDESHASIVESSGKDYMCYAQTFPGPIGHEDSWLFVLDSTGKQITDKVIGGSSTENPRNIIATSYGCKLGGTTYSNQYTEGINGKNISPTKAYISNLFYFPTRIIDERKSEDILSIFPNPATDELSIEHLSLNTKIDLFDLLGRNIFSTNSIKEKKTINLSSLPNGNYILQFTNADGSRTMRTIIKE